MPRFIILIVSLSILLASTQIFIKIGLGRIKEISLSLNLVADILSNIFFWFAGIHVIAASFLWFYILSKYPLSTAYPILISLSYILVIIASAVIFKEDISVIKWFGISIIILGIFLVVR